MSRREAIVQDVVTALTAADDPRFGFISREPFDFTQLSRQQFPAIYLSTSDEQRQDLTQLGRGGLRQSRLQLQLVGYVQGTEIDRLRNDIIERVEEAVDLDRTRSGQAMSTQLIEVRVDYEVIAPYGRVEILLEIVYQYQRGQA